MSGGGSAAGVTAAVGPDVAAADVAAAGAVAVRGGKEAYSDHPRMPIRQSQEGSEEDCG